MFDSFITLYTANPLAQTLGFFGMILVLSAFLQKEDTRTIQILAVANIFWIGHFFLMAAYPALASSIIGMARMFLSLKYKKNKRVFYGILAVVILMGVITYEDHISLLPTLAGCLSAYGYFFLEKIKLRFMFLVSALFRLTYNYNAGSIGGLLNETFVVIILLFTIYKLTGIEGTRWYYIAKIKYILSEHPLIDYGRYTIVSDYFQILKKTAWITYLKNFARESRRYILQTNKALFTKDSK